MKKIYVVPDCKECCLGFSEIVYVSIECNLSLLFHDDWMASNFLWPLMNLNTFLNRSVSFSIWPMGSRGINTCKADSVSYGKCTHASANRCCCLVVIFITKVLTRCPGPTFIKPDQLDPWIKDQIKITLLPTISHLLLPNFVSCGRACPSHMTQNLVTVGAKLWTADRLLVDPWSMDYADPVW